jgi:hypothetical protein
MFLNSLANAASLKEPNVCSTGRQCLVGVTLGSVLSPHESAPTQIASLD